MFCKNYGLAVEYYNGNNGHNEFYKNNIKTFHSLLLNCRVAGYLPGQLLVNLKPVAVIFNRNPSDNRVGPQKGFVQLLIRFLRLRCGIRKKAKNSAEEVTVTQHDLIIPLNRYVTVCQERWDGYLESLIIRVGYKGVAG